MAKKKKLKVEKKDRNKAAVDKLKKEQEGARYHKRIQLIQKENKYIDNLMGGRYHLARCNMIAEQLTSGEIKENLDGCPKSEDYLRCEYALSKKNAIRAFREAHFIKEELKKEFKVTEEQIEEIEADYYDGKIIRDSYDEKYKKGKKPAGFVSE